MYSSKTGKILSMYAIVILALLSCPQKSDALPGKTIQADRRPNIIIILAGLKLAAPIVNLLLLAFLLTGSIMPVIIWMIKKKVPKPIALISTFLLLIFGTVLIGSIVSVAVVQIADKVPHYESKLMTIKDNSVVFFSNLGFNIADISNIDVLSPGNLLEMATDFIAGIVSTFSNFALVLVMIIFLLIDTASLRYRIDKGDQELTPGWRRLEE